MEVDKRLCLLVERLRLVERFACRTKTLFSCRLIWELNIGLRGSSVSLHEVKAGNLTWGISTRNFFLIAVMCFFCKKKSPKATVSTQDFWR